MIPATGRQKHLVGNVPRHGSPAPPGHWGFGRCGEFLRAQRALPYRVNMDGGEIGWTGPPCPVCGLEFDAEVLATSMGAGLAYSCRVHGAVSVADPFTAED